eukprot:TRINITY_DN477_c0_g1_i3.p1 TRINITY_DN477_c0_g1~~TRINITY_DN477_c0_g1_i3.p1  ORF type:complete len:319 (-),score=40.31 TRINITY_DN477_c0_g1_i3:58-1014(-)
MQPHSHTLRSSFQNKVPAVRHQIATVVISCKQHEDLWKKFEDGLPNLMIENVQDIRGRDVVFFADFLDPGTMFEQLAVMYALPRYFIRSLTVVMPYFPTGTMERVDEEGQIATAFTLAVILSAIPLSSMGPAKLIIYDIHALQERFYFGNNVIPLLLTAIPAFKEKLEENHKGESIAIAFPDDGACKRFGRMFENYETIICAKVRDGDKRVVTIKEGQPKGYHVFIIDDLIKTGGTLIECKNALLSKGALKVSAFVTHAVFPLESYNKFTGEGPDQFQHFYTTDSCPTTVKIIKDLKPFHVISLKNSMVEALLQYGDR